MQKFRTAKVVLVAILGIAALVPGVVEAGPADWTGPLYPLEGMEVGFDDPVGGSKASYENGSRAVSFSVKTRGLQKGHGYTIWLMAFNAPENCVGSDAPDGFRCGMSDHMNPAAQMSVIYGAGAWATTGTVQFSGTRYANSTLQRPDGVVLGPGLINPSGAEVHLRVRDHGPRQACCAADQVGTFAGGCTVDSAPFPDSGQHGDYACADVQATAS